MKAQTRGGRLALVVAAAAASLTANLAAAQECDVDADCGAGYVCEIHSSGGCTDFACEPGEECRPVECETYEYGTCVNAPCEGDADCPDPMLCHTRSYEECDAEDYPGCPDDGTPCEPKPVEPPNCISYSEAHCRQPFELPCTADADCGGGFRCVEDIIRWCSGSGQVPQEDGVAVPLPETECGEERTGTFSCHLQELPCDADADCPSGLACVDNPHRVACSRPATNPPGPQPTAGRADYDDDSKDSDRAPMASGGEDEDASSASDEAPVSNDEPVSDDVPCEPVPEQPARLCMPAHGGYPSYGEDSDSSGTDVPTSTESGKGDQGTDDNKGEVVDDDDDSDQAVDEGEEGEPTADEGVPPRADADGKPRRGRRRGWLRRVIREHRGCSIASSGQSGGVELSWLLLAGALTVRAARRRR